MTPPLPHPEHLINIQQGQPEPWPPKQREQRGGERGGADHDLEEDQQEL